MLMTLRDELSSFKFSKKEAIVALRMRLAVSVGNVGIVRSTVYAVMTGFFLQLEQPTVNIDRIIHIKMSPPSFYIVKAIDHGQWSR